MGHERTARVIALQEEVNRLTAYRDELLGRYKMAYISYKLSGGGEQELNEGWDALFAYQKAQANLVKAYDLLHEAREELSADEQKVLDLLIKKG